MPQGKRDSNEKGSGSTQEGVIVLGHGSRCSGAADALARLAGQLQQQLGCRVLPASLQFNSPTLSESCTDLAAQGVAKIIIAPYFLFNGNHLKQDIPGEIEAIRAKLPDVELILAEHLGEDRSLVEILARRVAAACGTSISDQIESDQTLNERNQTKDGNAAAAGGAGEAPSTPHAIEAESFAIIDRLLEPSDSGDPRYQVSRRVVHATGDPELAGVLSFSSGAIEAGMEAFTSGAGIWCDVRMVASGIGPTASRRGLAVDCAIDDPRAAELSVAEGITRAAAALRLRMRGPEADGTVIAIGNAPTALFECLRLSEQGVIKPSLVIGVPVGFVGAAESKQALAASGLPHITLPGNRGGSSVAVAIVNAILNMGR
jgi:precorrin-8X/cobalt-precorrin-8 methylmutase